MMVLRGGPALSDFRIDKYHKTLQTICPEVVSLRTEYVHLVQYSAELDATETEHLHQLLNYGHLPSPEQDAAVSFLIIPRPGTISPWSSKATDIIRNCGLTKVTRAERGIAWTITYQDNYRPDATILAQIGAGGQRRAIVGECDIPNERSHRELSTVKPED